VPRRVRLGLFLATFAAWSATAGFALLTPECADPLGGSCPSNWASDAATAAVWAALVLTLLSVIVGVSHGVWRLVRAWRDRRELP
jgi:hypothetical protein